MTEQGDEHQPRSAHYKHQPQAVWLEMLVQLQWLLGHLSVHEASVFMPVFSQVYSAHTPKVHSGVEIQLSSMLLSQLIH